MAPPFDEELETQLIFVAHLKSFETFCDKLFERLNSELDDARHAAERVSDNTKNDEKISLARS